MVGLLVLVVLSIPSWIALVLGSRRRELRGFAGAVLVTAAIPVLYVCIRGAFYTPSSFDAVADGLGLLLELLPLAAVCGFLHLVSFLILVVQATEGPQEPHATSTDDQPSNDTGQHRPGP